MIFDVMESPHTAEPNASLKEATTPERNAYFWHVDNKCKEETMKSIAADHGIRTTTGRKWRRERKEYGTPSSYCMRKFKSHFQETKLGHPLKIPQKKLDIMYSPSSNPYHFQPLPIQMGRYNINVDVRTMERNLTKRKQNAQMYLAAYTKRVNPKNKVIQKSFGVENKHYRVIGYWDHVYFTDEAHYNLLECFQKLPVLQKEKHCENGENIAEFSTQNLCDGLGP
jgi:hypothetical protein